MLDDLNTPMAFAAMHELRGEAAKGRQAGSSLPEGERTIDRLVERTARRNGRLLKPALTAVDESKVVSLIDARTAARKAKDFKESDRIRDELAAMGVVLKD